MLQTLFEITQSINTIHNPQQLLNKVLDLAIDLGEGVLVVGQLGRIPVLARLLDDFAHFGCRGAVVVRGHRADRVDVDGARFVDNPDFATTGEAWSLALAEADLAPGTLVDAYRRGIFPWPHPDMPMPWFSPDPRGVIPVDGIHLSRSLRRTLRRHDWVATVDAAFPAVIAACGRNRGDAGTWITPAMVRAYRRLYELGWAHSVEIWDDERLVGALGERQQRHGNPAAAARRLMISLATAG